MKLLAVKACAEKVMFGSTVIHAVGSSATNRKQQQTASNGDVFQEHNGLHLVSKVMVEDRCDGNAESRQGVGGEACFIAQYE